MTEKMATRDAYGKALLELGRQDERIVVLDADLSGSTKTAEFAREFPHRFFNVGIAEADMMGTAAGLAAAGMIPFASTFGVFAAGRAFDQVRNSICYPRLKVNISATHTGLTVGEDGGSHQAVEDIALMRVLPNMTVFSPADGYQAGQIIKAAVQVQGPAYIRLGRPKVPQVIPQDLPFEVGRGQVLREGNHLVFMATGHMVAPALEAARALAERNIEAAVLNIHTIKPLDEELVVFLARLTKRVITVEEHSIIGGLGGAVAELLGERCPVYMKRIGIKDTFGESGTPASLLNKYGLTKEHITKTALDFLVETS